ncbi:MAG: hypothetical protein H0V70_30550 [Ktedonobacteraceae bacterium]|nr:hypothetical protein [Ktedonobacteraceae bacterium]
MSSTPLSYQELLTLSQELSTTENIHERDRLIAQLISTIEQRIPLMREMSKNFLENIKAQKLAVTILEQNAAHIPIDEIIRMNFLDEIEVNQMIQKIITIRRADIPITPFLDGLLYDDRLIRIEAIKGLKALREYAPVEILLATIHDADHIETGKARERYKQARNYYRYPRPDRRNLFS